jgi:hypothetical protein
VEAVTAEYYEEYFDDEEPRKYTKNSSPFKGRSTYVQDYVPHQIEAQT